MKSIPPGFCEAADHAPIPGRPWWRSVNGGFTRRDGKFDVWPGVPVWMGADTEAEFRANPRNVFVEPLEWTLGNPTADLSHVIAAVERIDAEHPLPHPGYRAGQVWLVGTTTWICTDAWVDGPRRRVVPHNVTMDGAFLLHDPLMPSKAPWGPA